MKCFLHSAPWLPRILWYVASKLQIRVFLISINLCLQTRVPCLIPAGFRSWPLLASVSATWLSKLWLFLISQVTNFSLWSFSCFKSSAIWIVAAFFLLMAWKGFQKWQKYYYFPSSSLFVCTSLSLLRTEYHPHCCCLQSWRFHLPVFLLCHRRFAFLCQDKIQFFVLQRKVQVKLNINCNFYGWWLLLQRSSAGL